MLTAKSVIDSCLCKMYRLYFKKMTIIAKCIDYIRKMTMIAEYIGYIRKMTMIAICIDYIRKMAMIAIRGMIQKF